MSKSPSADSNPHWAQSRLRKARIEAEFTQDYMAAELGIEQATYARLESGLKQVKLQRMEEAARILGKPLSWFFLTEEEEKALETVEEQEAFYDQKNHEIKVLTQRIKQMEMQVIDMRKSADYQDELIKRLKEELKVLKAQVKK